MPKRKTLQDIREAVYELSHGQTKLISSVYQNTHKQMEFQCFCGNIFKRSFDKLSRGHFLCPECAKQSKSERFRMNFEDVKQRITDAGCKYISGDYVNNQSILTLECSCGEVFKKRMVKFFSGQTRCNKCGYDSLAQQKMKYDYPSAKKIFKEHGYDLLENEYKGYEEKHLCICSNGHTCNIVLSWLLSNGTGCPLCAEERRKGANSPLYIDGRAKVQDLLRNALKQWRADVRSAYDNTCPITGKHGRECDVHHIIPLSQIYDTTCQKYNSNVPIGGKLSDFESYEQFDNIKREIISSHKISNGILIAKTIHNQFHRQTKKDNPCADDFDAFLRLNYNTKLSCIALKGGQ